MGNVMLTNRIYLQGEIRCLFCKITLI